MVIDKSQAKNLSTNAKFSDYQMKLYFLDKIGNYISCIFIHLMSALPPAVGRTAVSPLYDYTKDPPFLHYPW